MSSDCPICFESLKNLEKICGEDCGHVICSICYDHMYKTSKKVKCPVCRIPLVSVNKPANKRAIALSNTFAEHERTFGERERIVIPAPVKVRKVAQPKLERCVGGRCKPTNNSDMFFYNFSVEDFDFDFDFDY